jgi:zinc transport system permease protein
MALGIIFIALTPGYAPNLMSFLFGSILTVSANDLLFFGILTVIISALFLFFYRTILAISFDEDFARARNLPVDFFNYLVIAVASLTIVASIRISGVILVLSLLTLPQATANIFLKKFGSIMIASIFIGFIGMITGIYLSYYTDLPSGAMIIVVLTSFFTLAKLLKQILR